MHEHQHPVPISFPAATWLSDHAAERCAQRNINEADLAYVMRHGFHTRTAQADHVVLRRRDIPVSDRGVAALARLEGTVVVMDDGRGITVYRNRKALRAIRRKSKWTFVHRAA